MKLLLLLSFLPALGLSCYTGGYNSFFDGQCLNRYTNTYLNYDDAKNRCESEDSHLLMLKTEADEKAYTGPTGDNYNHAWLGLECDGVNFVWADGSIATYTVFKNKDVCNSDNKNRRYYISSSDGWWYSYDSGHSNTFYPVCQGSTRSWICDTYHLLQQGKSDDLCYLLDQKDTLVDQGEANCESQKAFISPIHDQSLNDFVKRTAVSYGLMQGIHIGLKYVDGKYIWSDGSEADYLNFAPGFPDPSFGECLAMGTGLFPGKWMNVNCTTPLPYMCTKAAGVYDESIPPAGCSDDGEFYPEDEIFAPTWGAATGPAYCDYALMDIEDKTRKITAEIVLFESNSCCDTLTIYDGLFGTNVLKKFTGYLGITSVVVKGTTNAIRMEWNATSGAHVRGWHVKVGSVAD